MTLGLRAKILLIATGALLVSMGAVIAVSNYVFNREYTSALQSRSAAIATGLKVQLERVLQLGIPLDNLIGFEEQLAEAVTAYQGIDYAMVAAPDGRILFHSEAGRQGRIVDEPEVLDAVRSGKQATVPHRSPSTGHRDYGVIVPVTDLQGAHLASVVVDFPAGIITGKAAAMAAFNLGAGAVFLVGGVIALVVGLSLFVTSPLTRLIGAIESIRRDTADLSHRIQVSSRDEIGRLARAFNSLMEDLQATTVSKTELEKAMHEIKHAATHDALTGLPNRNLMRDRLIGALAYARRYGRHTTVVYIDLDDFKVINDSLGHDMGDTLLKTIADRLSACVREVDTVSRVGGDEFVILLFDQPEEGKGIVPVLERVQESIRKPIAISGREYNITPSMGFAIFPQDGADADTLVPNADVAMYRAKELGRNNFQAYSNTMRVRLAERLAVHNGLLRAIEQHELLVYYQPQADLRTGKIVGAEALVRWRHPDRGLVPPDRFIPVAEETGLIAPIGEFVLRTACAQTRDWQSQGLPSIRIAVNLSPRQFWEPKLPKVVQKALHDAGLEPSYLELELTESLVMRSVEEAVKTMKAFRAMGVGLAMDDFGTGYSSLSALQRLPLNRLKIAQAFMRDVPSHPDSVAIAQAIISLGHTLKLTVIAEGVETAEQLEFLRANGCDEIQGYLLGKPMPPEQLAELLAARGGTVKPLA
ncbi:MAG: EAL domain-containing protein [Betaproteobacteria bacterium]|nr:EAL domain-containing protein [Betaproteobacteria bacterium]